MKKTAFLCLLLIASLHARADVFMVETMKNGPETATIVTKIKGNKARIDIASQSVETGETSQSSVITDLVTGDIITLVHESKSFVKFTPDKSKALVDDIQKTKTAVIAAPKISDTGKSEKVGDYSTEIYVAKAGATKFAFWIAKDFPDFASLQDQMRKYQILQAALKRKFGMLDDLGPDIWSLDGMAVQTIVVSETPNEKGTPVVTTTIMSLVSAKDQPLDDADFQVPPGYNEMDQATLQPRPQQQPPTGAPDTSNVPPLEMTTPGH